MRLVKVLGDVSVWWHLVGVLVVLLVLTLAASLRAPRRLVGAFGSLALVAAALYWPIEGIF